MIRYVLADLDKRSKEKALASAIGKMHTIIIMGGDQNLADNNKITAISQSPGLHIKMQVNRKIHLSPLHQLSQITAVAIATFNDSVSPPPGMVTL